MVSMFQLIKHQKVMREWKLVEVQYALEECKIWGLLGRTIMATMGLEGDWEIWTDRQEHSGSLADD